MRGVVVLGDLMVDVVARLRGPLVLASDSPASIAVRGGGSAANTACWLATSGVETVFVGKVGDDSAGRQAVAELRSFGVRTVVGIDASRPTGTVIVLVDEAGERTMVPDAGANSGLVPGDLPVAEFVAGRHLHLSGYTLLNPASRAAGLAALELARRSGMTTSLDVASAGPLADAGDMARGWLAGVDVVFANLDEARTLTGIDDPEAAVRALAERSRSAVVKLGADGAVWHDGQADAPVRVTAVKVAEPDVMDTTGAGDAFAAGFLAHVSDAKVADTLEAGCRLAACAITHVGGRPIP